MMKTSYKLLGNQARLLISWREYVQKCNDVQAYVTKMVYKLTKVCTNNTCH